MDNENYEQILIEATFDILKATCHILIIENDEPNPWGTGVLLEIDGFKFLITAAHIVDDDIHNIVIGIDTNEFFTPGGDWKTNIPFDERENDRIDMSILKLDQESIDKISLRYDFLKDDVLGINHEYTLQQVLVAVGFPGSLSPYNEDTKIISSKPFVYRTIPAELNIYEQLGIHKSSNIIVIYDQENIQNSKTKETQVGPYPFGMSGGGLWFIPPQIKQENTNLSKKLVAILTEWPPENRRVIIGTRIDLITETIRHLFNVKLTKSKILKVKL